MQYGPDPNAIYPNENIKSVCFIKNVIKRPNIIVGDYTYYSDPDGPERFEERVTHHYEFLGDKLIIGKFCAIAKGVEFIMNGANHRMCSVTTTLLTLWATAGKRQPRRWRICLLRGIPLLATMCG